MNMRVGTIKKAERQRIDAFKLWCWKRLESPLSCKEIQPVHPKGNQSSIFIRRTDAEAETPILWPPNVNNWLIWIDSDAGKDWRWEKPTTEGEMVGWYHRLNGHWVWASFGNWWWTGKFVCRVRHNWATELNCVTRGTGLEFRNGNLLISLQACTY